MEKVDGERFPLFFLVHIRRLFLGWYWMFLLDVPPNKPPKASIESSRTGEPAFRSLTTFPSSPVFPLSVSFSDVVGWCMVSHRSSIKRIQHSVSCFRCLLAYSPLPLHPLRIALLRTYVPTYLHSTRTSSTIMPTLCLRTLLCSH